MGEISYSYLFKEQVTDALIEECRALFDAHYGVWSANHPKWPSQRVRLPHALIRRYVDLPGGRAAIARDGDRLIGYAFATRFMTEHGIVSWVTQLVVHTDYQNRKVGTRLINAIWAFSDDFAWGLVSANPFAIRALEKATRRRCDPELIARRSADLHSEIGRRVHYLGNAALRVDSTCAVMNTDFRIDHSRVPEMLAAATRQLRWRLGELLEGEEWFAVTFQQQEQIGWTAQEWEQFMDGAETTLVEAYNRMATGMEAKNGHPWERHTEAEIDRILGSGLITSSRL